MVSPGTITVDAGGATLTADGRSALLLSLTVVDGDGLAAPIDTDLGLTSSLGSLGEVSWSAAGTAAVTYTAGTWPDTATLSAGAGWSVAGDAEIELRNGTGYATQLHIHGSISEGSGTMAGHVEAAEDLGLDALWWSDHDHRYHSGGYFAFNGLSFESPDMPLADDTGTGWDTTHNSFWKSDFSHSVAAAHSGSRGLRINVKASHWASASDPDEATWDYRVIDNNNYRSLMSELSMSFWIKAQRFDRDTELFIEVPLSRMTSRRAEPFYRSIVFVASLTDYTSDTRTLYVPFVVTESGWTQVEADLTDLARDHWGDIAVDLHAELITITARGHSGAWATWQLDDLELSADVLGEDLRTAQREYLDSLESDVAQLIGVEISHVTNQHANAFYPSDDWTFLDYRGPDSIEFADAADQVHSEGGVISYNHMFGAGSGLLPDAEIAVLVEEAVDLLSTYEGFGADLLEVGYRKRTGALDDFTEVWDRLAVEAGLIMTGIGTSDQHHQVAGRDKNNFVTWICSASGNAEDMIAALSRGHVWYGDPEVFASASVSVSVVAPESQATMGQVIEGATGTQPVLFHSSWLRTGWEVRAVVDGVETETWTVSRTGAFTANLMVAAEDTTLVRFEVYDARLGAVLFTNPIYFVPAGTTIDPDRVPAP